MTDLVITASQVQPGTDNSIETALASEAVTAGQLVYKNANGLWALFDADNTSHNTGSPRVALNTAGINQPLQAAYSGTMTLGAAASLTIGEIYVASGAAGGIAPEGDLAAGDRVVIVGVGATAATIKLVCQNSGILVPNP